MNYEELDGLISAAIEERLDDSGQRRLTEILLQDRAALDIYLECFNMHSLLIGLFRKE